RAACLNRLGIYTVGQLLHHAPRRHLDLRRTTAVADLIEGVQVTVIGTVSRVHWRPAGSEPGLWIGQATLTDDHGDTLELVWFARAKDRKSTRLNSSHVKISYAVFCLKKKKKTNTIHY